MEKRIRSVDVADAPAIRRIYAPHVTGSVTSFETEPPDVETMEQRIRDLRDRYPWLVFEASGAVLGYAYASPHRARRAYQWCTEVSVYVDSVAQRCGAGRALYTALFAILRRQGYVNAYAGIALPNPRSVSLHQALGFTPVGVFNRIGYKFGQWHDVLWLQLQLLETSNPAPEPGLAAEWLLHDEIVEICRREAESVKYESPR